MARALHTHTDKNCLLLLTSTQKQSCCFLPIPYQVNFENYIFFLLDWSKSWSVIWGQTILPLSLKEHLNESSWCGFRTLSLPAEDREVTWRHVFQRKWNCFCPERGQIRETASDRALESYSSVLGLLRHAWRSKLSPLKLHTLRAVFLACGHTCQDTVAKKDEVLLIENLHMLNAYIVQFNVTTAFSFFFSIYARLLILMKLVCGQHNKEQKKALKNFYMKKETHWQFVFFCFVFCLS